MNQATRNMINTALFGNIGTIRSNVRSCSKYSSSGINIIYCSAAVAVILLLGIEATIAYISIGWIRRLFHEKYITALQNELMDGCCHIGDKIDFCYIFVNLLLYYYQKSKPTILAISLCQVYVHNCGTVNISMCAQHNIWTYKFYVTS